eukprot:SAG31_NODE_1224_length_9286_cov_11.643953_1_plen_72_part_00
MFVVNSAKSSVKLARRRLGVGTFTSGDGTVVGCGNGRGYRPILLGLGIGTAPGIGASSGDSCDRRSGVCVD